MLSFSEFDPQTLARQLEDWGHKPAHGLRLLRAFYNGNGRPLNLPDLGMPRALAQSFAGQIQWRGSRVAHCHQSVDGTAKLLIALAGGGAVESVLMPSHRPDRAAGCVSSQIGCAMGCDFCASTRNGLERSLGVGEIVEQFLHLRELAESQNRRLMTIVFMGMGEPMHNLDNVMAAIRRICDARMGSLGWKHATVSTVGIVPGIDRLAESGLNVPLAISLHAPDDATRRPLVPMGKRFGVAEILAAAHRYYQKTGRIVTFEYCLLADVNDSDAHARELAGLIGTLRAHVNLIPYNAIGAGLSGTIYRRPSPQRMKSFCQILRGHKIVAHFRQTRGDEINAACGQLRETLVPLGIAST